MNKNVLANESNTFGEEINIKAAKTSGAHVIFINCTRLCSFDIANLKKIGGDNVKFA